MSVASTAGRQTGRVPPFVRKAWTDPEARAIHSPRAARAAAAWEAAEWRSANAVRPCALISVLSPDFSAWTTRIDGEGLALAPLRVMDVSPEDAVDQVFSTEIVIGSARNVKAFRSAWIDKNNDKMGALLGYPSCCRALFQRAFAADRVEDLTWSIACATPNLRLAGRLATVAGLRETNILLRRIGVRGIPHFPCSFACEDSRVLSRAMTDIAAAHGYGEEIKLLYEMLDWPIRWTALHGIAEIRSPVLKIATHTDPTAEMLTLDWLGQTVPAAAAHGVDFPYLEPVR